MKEVLYHGSATSLRGTHLLPNKAHDHEERPENNKEAVYASSRKDLAIFAALISCKDVLGGSVDNYKEGKLNARIYGNYPKQKYIWLHTLPKDGFTQTRIDKHQYFKEDKVKPIKTEKLLVKNCTHVARIANEQEQKEWEKNTYKKNIKKGSTPQPFHLISANPFTTKLMKYNTFFIVVLTLFSYFFTHKHIIFGFISY